MTFSIWIPFYFLFFLVLGLASGKSVPIAITEEEIERDLNTSGLIKRHGYHVEEHQVITKDGYMLTIYRIPGPKGSQPVLLQHGLLSSSADWVVMRPGNSLAYLVSDAGYDVWLGNNRGNYYSKAHTNLSVDSDEYWDFSWHQMGEFDLPAMIDYILEKTSHEKIFYVGHSQGTTQFFVMNSVHPEYNDKIKLGIALAPVAFMGNVKSLVVRFMAAMQNTLEEILKLFGIREFLPPSEFLDVFGKLVCNDEAITQELCANVFFLLGGFNSQELNRTMLTSILGHVPAGASVKQLLHYGQNIKHDNQFRMYDYGAEENRNRYGSKDPPEYPLDKITAPMAFFYSENDLLADPVDVHHLANILSDHIIGRFHVTQNSFNHLDYLFAIHVKEYVNSFVVSLINRYA